MTHGQRINPRPPTPMNMVMGFEFARIGAKKSEKVFAGHVAEKKKVANLKHSGPTKASLGHALGAQHRREKSVPVDDREKWCLSKFKRVKGTLRAYIDCAPTHALGGKSDHSRSREYM